MTTTTKLILGAALVVGGIVVYRRTKASSQTAGATSPLSTLRNIVDSGKTALAGVTASAPATVTDYGGTHYGTPSTTNTVKATRDRTMVAVDPRDRTYSQDAMLGLVSTPQFRA